MVDGIPLPLAMTIIALAWVAGMYFAEKRPDLALRFINWILNNPKKVFVIVAGTLITGLVARILRAIIFSR